jgi:uncharacterized damage-inducible protein DinB
MGSMDSASLLEDTFSRIRAEVHAVLAGLGPDDLVFRPDPGANSIAWLVWHLTRIQDDHVANVAGSDQVWTAGGWSDRFGLPLDVADTGWGHGPDQVAAVRADAELLRGYYDATDEATLRYVRTLSSADLDRVVDTHWDPPVTLGVRLVSVIGDDLQHVGQAAYVKGIVQRR